jgi:6-hydroxynicotinate reductase
MGSAAAEGDGCVTHSADKLSLDARSKQFGAAEADGIIRCDACPVLCRIRPGRPGACSRYANEDGRLVRTDPVVLLQHAVDDGVPLVAFAGQTWDGGALDPARTFVTGVGAGTTYPDYKPAPFIVAAEHAGVDTVTVVTEGIFSYCGVKVKIDTDRHLGAETAIIRVDNEAVGHVTTAEYGSQMLSIGGVRHLTGGSKKEGNVTCETLLKLCSGEAVTLQIDGGHRVVVQSGQAPIVDDKAEVRMRVGCGSATVGIFAQQWAGHVDEVIVVDDHITGVLSEHQAGRVLNMRPAGIRIRGRKSTPGRYFKVAEPGLGWGGTNIADPLSIIQSIDAKTAWPGLRLLFTSTTGEDALYCILDDNLKPIPTKMPAAVGGVVSRIGENCEPSVCSVIFMAGAGGSLRAGVTENPVLLTQSVQRGETRVTMGGADVHVWAGGGITIMADVARLPRGSFGYVPTPAIVAPIEFTLPRSLYLALGGHAGDIVRIEDMIATVGQTARIEPWKSSNPWPFDRPRLEEKA